MSSGLGAVNSSIKSTQVGKQAPENRSVKSFLYPLQGRNSFFSNPKNYVLFSIQHYLIFKI